MPENEPQQHSELATFGEELRREREIRGISLKEIADATKVSKRFLDAIEKNDHRSLPAPVFTRGFVREYARYLGLNSDEIVNRYNYAAAGDDRIEKSVHLERLARPETVRVGNAQEASRPRPRQDIPPAYRRIDGRLVVLVIVAAALGAVTYWAVTHKREARRDEVAVTPAAAPPPATATAPRPPVVAPATAAAAAMPAGAAADLHLSIDARENSWITLSVDGKQVFSDELKEGEHRSYDAKQEFRFGTIGNAAGIDLTLNGVPIASSGEEGQVVHDRVLTHATLDEARRTAEAPRNTP